MIGNDFFNVLLSHSSSEIVRNVISGINDSSIMSLTDARGAIVAVNDNFIAISGYGKEELIGKPHSIVNSGYHSKEFWAGMWMTVRAGNVWRNEICNRRKDGSLYWVDSFIYPIKNEDQNVVHYLSIRNDITEKKEQEIKSLDLKGKLEAIYNSTKEMNFLVDEDAKILSFNAAAYKGMMEIYGKPVSLGQNLVEFIVVEAKQVLIHNIKECVATKNKIQTERKIKTPAGKEEWFLTTYTPAFDHNGLAFGVSVNFESITARKKFELELQTRNDQLERIAWMQSHGLRAPIASLLGLLHLVELDNSSLDSPSMRSHIKLITHEIDRQIRSIVAHTNDLETLYKN